MSYSLFDDQVRVKREIYHNWNNGIQRQIMGAGTGFGKTVVSGSIINDAISKGKKPMFLVDRISLAHQAVNHFDKLGHNVSLYQGENTQIHWDENCIVASIHTLQNRRVPECDLILVDECHINHKHYNHIFETFDNVKALGLSATPLSSHLAKQYETIVKAPTMAELIAMDRLVPFRIYAISEDDLKEIAIIAGEWSTEQLVKKYATKLHMTEVVDTWERLGENRKTIAFPVDINHAKIMADSFCQAGIKAAQINCHMKQGDIDEIIRDFNYGSLQIIISVGKLTTGFDSPIIGCVIDDAPTLSLARFIQKLGRGPRKYEGKKDVIVIDHTVNCIIHGHPALYEIPDLINGEIVEAEKKKKTYVCKACKYTTEVKFDICPNCGKEVLMATDDYRKEIGFGRLPAELKEFKAQEKQRKAEEKEAKRQAREEKRQNDRIQFIRELKTEAHRRGQPIKWIYGVYKRKYKGEDLPVDPSRISPAEVSDKTANYLYFSGVE